MNVLQNKDLLSTIFRCLDDYDDLVAVNLVNKQFCEAAKELFKMIPFPKTVARNWYSPALKEALQKYETAQKTNPAKSGRQEAKVVVMGDASVGKSASVVQFIQGVFVERYDPTIEDSYRKLLKGKDGTEYLMDVLDTAGSEQFTAMKDLYMKRADCLVILYDVTEAKSLEDVAEYVAQYRRVNVGRTAHDSIILAGNKLDLGRQVMRRQGSAVARELGIGFIETSAKTRQGLDELFLEAAILSACTQTAPVVSEQPLFEDEMAQLAAMGFADQERCLRLLRAHDGDIERVITALVE